MRRTGPGAVWLVISAVVMAGLACSVTITTAHFEDLKLIEDAASDTRARSYRAGDTFYLSGELVSVDAGETVPVRAVWRYTETATGEARDEVVAEQTLEVGNGPLLLDVPPPADGAHAPGQYEVTVFLSGDVQETISFKVR